MVRFLAGVAIGGAVTYWYMTGVIPFRDEVSSWFSRTSPEVTLMKPCGSGSTAYGAPALTPTPWLASRTMAAASMKSSRPFQTSIRAAAPNSGAPAGMPKSVRTRSSSPGAKRPVSTPFGTTIAHGFLTLSLLTWLDASIPKNPASYSGMVMGVNYGFEKVRFVSPVKVNSKIRMRRRSVRIAAQVHRRPAVPGPLSENDSRTTQKATELFPNQAVVWFYNGTAHLIKKNFSKCLF